LIRTNELLSSYSALLVVRVDLSYVVNPDIEQVDADLEKLRRKISRSSYGDDLLLLVWALEQGNGKATIAIWHWFIMSISALVLWYCQRVNELWQKITFEDGYYFNCHS
jgi:hypothetical protein